MEHLKPPNFVNATGLSICTKLSAFSPDSMSGWQPSDAMVDLSAAGQAQLTIASPLANGMDIGYHPIFKQTQMNRNDDFCWVTWYLTHETCTIVLSCNLYSKFPEEKTVLKLMASGPGCPSLNSEFWAKVGPKLW
jgi:hypothetical protein